MTYDEARKTMIASYNELLPAERPPQLYSLDSEEDFVSGLGLLAGVYEYLVKTNQTDQPVFSGLNNLLADLFAEGDSKVREAIDLGFIEHFGLEDPPDKEFCHRLLSHLPDCLQPLYEQEMQRW